MPSAAGGFKIIDRRALWGNDRAREELPIPARLHNRQTPLPKLCREIVRVADANEVPRWVLAEAPSDEDHSDEAVSFPDREQS